MVTKFLTFSTLSELALYLYKGPVKLMQQVKVAHSFLQSVKFVPLYHFKLAYILLPIVVKEFFETYF